MKILKIKLDSYSFLSVYYSIRIVGQLMNIKEIINKLELIEGSLDDAFYSLPEYNANSDSRDYIDSARNELYCLKEDIEK